MAQVLKMLPVVNLDLNKDQKQILNSTRNLFILGRSGTGKTTTTILRFFCQEIMYMAMRKQERLLNHYYNMGMQQKYTATKKAIPRLSSEDVKDTTNVKMVFVTASPVLTNEVKQYYASLREQLSAHLLVIEKAEAKKSEEIKEDDSDKAELIDTTQEKQEKEEHKEKLLKFLEIREKEIL